MKFLGLLLSLICLVGCYNPTYTTSQGVNVFCKYGDDTCPDKADMEQAIDFYIKKAPEVIGWTDVQKEFDNLLFRIFWYKELLDCPRCESGKATGLIKKQTLGYDLSLWYPDSGKIKDSAWIQEFTKPFCGISLTGTVDYTSECWTMKIPAMVKAYKEFLDKS